MSRGAMRKLLPILETCMGEADPTVYSDLQLGKCFEGLNISAGLWPYFSDAYLNHRFRFYHPSPERRALRNASTVPSILPLSESVEQPISVHSVRSGPLMHKIHAQLRSGAVPMSMTWKPSMFEAVKCFHNPSTVGTITSCRGMPW